MDTGLACLDGEDRLGGRVGLEDEVLVAGLPPLSSMITPAQRHHSAVRVHTRCFWIGAALPPASDRQRGGSRRNSPRAELGTHTHDLAARYSMPAHAQTVRVAPIGRTGRIPRFDPGKLSATSHARGQGLALTCISQTVWYRWAACLQVGYMSRGSGPRCAANAPLDPACQPRPCGSAAAWPHVQIYRARARRCGLSHD